MREPATVAALAAVTAHRCHDRVAAAWREPDTVSGHGGWRSTTWGELATTWRHGALGLEAHGVDLGDRVGVVGAPGPHSMAIDHAVLASGAVSVLVGQDELGDLSRAGVRRVVAGPRSTSAEADQRGFEIVDWDAAVRDGATVDRERPDRFEKLVERLSPDALAIVDVTATGIVELTHAEVLWVARSFDRLVCIPSDEERDEHTVAFLPMRGLLGRTVAHYWSSAIGATVWFPGPLAAVDAVREAQPTVLAAPAEVWRDLAGAAIADANDRWVALGRLAVAGEHLGPIERALHSALRRLFRKRGQRRLGLDRCNAPLVVGTADRVTLRELAAVGVEVRLTWSDATVGGLITAGPMGGRDPNAVGQPLPGASVRIGGRGIDVRAPGRVEWVPTGVPGRLDADGGLHLTR